MKKLVRVLLVGCLLLSFSCKKKDEIAVSNSETPQRSLPRKCQCSKNES